MATNVPITGTIRPTPQNATLSAIARALRFREEAQARLPRPTVLGTLADLMLPTSETVEKWSYGEPLFRMPPPGTGGYIPVPTTDKAYLAESLGMAPVVAPLSRGVNRAAQKAGDVAVRAITRNPEATALGVLREAEQMAPLASVIKPKGGNWLSGSVERAVDPLKSSAFTFSANANKSDAALNKWLDQKLNKYIRNEMATPEDSLRLQADAFAVKKAELLAEKDKQLAKAIADMERAQAERGVAPEMLTQSQARIRELQKERAYIEAQTGLHYNPPEVYGASPSRLGAKRVGVGMPAEDMGQTPLARYWEAVSDLAVLPYKAKDFLKIWRQDVIDKEQPWLRKVSPETTVHDIDETYKGNLGFDHLIDELKNAMDAGSGLPDKLRITPEDLEKMTVPRAAKLVDEINAWRSVQKAEADAARAGNKATVEYRAYDTVPGTNVPNEKGLRWVELKMPEPDPSHELSGAALDAYKKMSPQGQAEVLDDLKQASSKAEARKILEDALKYEGEMLEHCVGGYCSSVVSGESRIFSLRDSSGKPQTTIELKPKPFRGNPFDLLTDAELASLGPRSAPDWSEKAMALAREKVPETITEVNQIKGANNRAPSREMVPFIIDYLNSLGDVKFTQMGVGDLNRLGVVDLLDARSVQSAMRDMYTDEVTNNVPKRYIDMFNFAVELEPNAPRFMNQRQLRDFIGPVEDDLGQNFAEGGAVKRKLPEPTLLNSQLWAETAARDMYPNDDVRRDAARHLFASALYGNKLTPRMAEMLGKLHEYKTSPLRSMGYALGLNEMPPDYAMDTHNNELGARMAPLAGDTEKLRAAVREAIKGGAPTREKGRVYLMPEPDPATQGYAAGGAVEFDPDEIAQMAEEAMSGYAAGGLVEYDPNEIDTIVSKMREAFHG